MSSSYFAFESMKSYADEWVNITNKTILFTGTLEDDNFYDVGSASVVRDSSGIFSFNSTGTYSIEISGGINLGQARFSTDGWIDLNHSNNGATTWNTLYSIYHYKAITDGVSSSHENSYYYRTNINIDNLSLDRVQVTVDGTDGIAGSTNIVFSKLVPITLTQGETGPAGADGADGQQGLQGIQGLKGDTGSTGATGAQGPQGEQGIQGPAGLKGDQGAQGAQGPAGADGVDGKDGVDGVNGSNGIQGPQGEQGIQGPKGDIGPTGPIGPAGPTGADGQDADPITHSGSGNQSDSFTGNDGVIDTFEIETKSKYNKRTADVITNFSTKDGDQLGLDCDKLGLDKIQFKIVNNKKGQKKHCSRGTNLIYNKNNNKLFVDLNGKEKGFGDGGLLAKFDDNSSINKNSIIDIMFCDNLAGTAGPGGTSF